MFVRAVHPWHKPLGHGHWRHRILRCQHHVGGHFVDLGIDRIELIERQIRHLVTHQAPFGEQPEPHARIHTERANVVLMNCQTEHRASRSYRPDRRRRDQRRADTLPMEVRGNDQIGQKRLVGSIAHIRKPDQPAGCVECAHCCPHNRWSPFATPEEHCVFTVISVGLQVRRHRIRRPQQQRLLTLEPCRVDGQRAYGDALWRVDRRNRGGRTDQEQLRHGPTVGRRRHRTAANFERA